MSYYKLANGQVVVYMGVDTLGREGYWEGLH